MNMFSMLMIVFVASLGGNNNCDETMIASENECENV